MQKGIKKIATIVALCSWSMFGNTISAKEKDYKEALFSTGKIASVELEIPEDTWREITNKARDKAYNVCSVTINGERMDSVAIRTKGASSLDDVMNMKSDRFSFTLNLNKYVKGQKYHGLSKLLLNNNIWDATQMKDAIVYDMCCFIGLPAPLTNYACIKLNGKLHGYYLLVEPVGKNFCKRNYTEKENNIYEPYHNLAYNGDDLNRYREIKDFAKVNGGEESMKRVVEALKSVDEGKDIDAHVDVESVMKYMAIQTIAVNYDCMTGHNNQNYYLREAEGRISLIPWDYNLAWGGYPDDEGDWGWGGGMPFWGMPFWGNPDESGPSPSLAEPQPGDGNMNGDAVSKIVNFPIDTPFSGDLKQRTFFMNLLANEQYKALYYHYLDILCTKYIMGGELNNTMTKIQNEIGDVAGTEPNAFYNNEQFKKACKTLQLLLERKAESVIGQMKGQIPATWDGQEAHPELLIKSNDINLLDLGGI